MLINIISTKEDYLDLLKDLSGAEKLRKLNRWIDMFEDSLTEKSKSVEELISFFKEEKSKLPFAVHLTSAMESSKVTPEKLATRLEVPVGTVRRWMSGDSVPLPGMQKVALTRV